MFTVALHIRMNLFGIHGELIEYPMFRFLVIVNITFRRQDFIDNIQMGFKWY